MLVNVKSIHREFKRSAVARAELVHYYNNNTIQKTIMSNILQTQISDITIHIYRGYVNAFNRECELIVCHLYNIITCDYTNTILPEIEVLKNGTVKITDS